MQKKFKIEVDCANCAAKIETAIKALPGVKNASVSFMAQKLLLEADDANEKRQTSVMNELDEKIARGDAGLKIAEERAARRRQLAGLVAEEQRAADVEHQTDLIMTDLEKRTASVKENIAKNEADRAALSQAEADLLNTEAFTNASAVGDNGTALKEASLGRKYGLDFYCDQNVQKTTAETANYTPSIAFHKNAFALVTRQLEMPLGAPKAYSTSYDGFGLRVVQGYDQKTKTDTVSIDMLCGVKTLSPELAAVITDKR